MSPFSCVPLILCLGCIPSSQRIKSECDLKAQTNKNRVGKPRLCPRIDDVLQTGLNGPPGGESSPIGQFQRDFGVRHRLPGSATDSPEPAAIMGGGDPKATAIFRTPRQEPGIDEPPAGIDAKLVHPCIGKAKPNKERQFPAGVCRVSIHDLFG